MIRTTPEYDAANLARVKKPVFKIVIDGYSRIFVSYATGVAGQYPWLESLSPQGVTVSDLEGGAELGQLRFTVFDIAAAITGDMPGFVFEGKKVQLYHGFVGLAQAKFALLFTGQIDTVDSDDSNNAYTFVCSDNKKRLTQVVFKIATDGFPTDSVHTIHLVGHPLDILVDILITELGYPGSEVNLAKIYNYRDAIYAGWNDEFIIDSPPAAKDFIEKQIMQPLGAYIWVNSKGQIDVNFFLHDNRLGAQDGGLIGAFVDGAGALVFVPFPVPIENIGETFSVKVPTGATALQFGGNDDYWPDNIGGWNLNVSGTLLTVGSYNRPWESSLNPEAAYGETGSTAPISMGVTPGATLVITYLSGTGQKGVGAPFVTPIGDLTAGSVPNGPGPFSRTPLAPISQFSLNATNLTGDLPVATQAPLCNTVSFHFDKDSNGKYLSEAVVEAGDSIALYDMGGQQVIESDGLRSGFQAQFAAVFVGNLIGERYGYKSLLIKGLRVHWKDGMKIEPGDVGSLTLVLFPDRIAGVKGVTNKLFEVLDREYDYSAHVVTLTLLDMTRTIDGLGVNGTGFYLITNDAEPVYTSASVDDKAELMFMANASDQYSNGDPAHQVG